MAWMAWEMAHSPTKSWDVNILGTSPDGLLSQESILGCRSLTTCYAPPIFLPLGKIYGGCSGLFLSIHLSSFTQFILMIFSLKASMDSIFGGFPNVWPKIEDFPIFRGFPNVWWPKNIEHVQKLWTSRIPEDPGPSNPTAHILHHVRDATPGGVAEIPFFLEESSHFWGKKTQFVEEKTQFVEEKTQFFEENTIVLSVLTAFHKSRSWQKRWISTIIFRRSLEHFTSCVALGSCGSPLQQSWRQTPVTPNSFRKFLVESSKYDCQIRMGCLWGYKMRRCVASAPEQCQNNCQKMVLQSKQSTHLPTQCTACATSEWTPKSWMNDQITTTLTILSTSISQLYFIVKFKYSISIHIP